MRVAKKEVEQLPFFIVRENTGPHVSLIGVDGSPFQTYEEAYATAEKRYPGIEFSIIEAETPRGALPRASGVEFPPFKGE